MLGVTKAYTTRVGDGPMPTELTDETGDRLRRQGNEFGAVTGRPRRCGWFDAVVVRYAARVNGLDAMALTKLDVLDGFDEVKICVGYRANGCDIREFPGALGLVSHAEPIYETMAGWTAPTSGVRRIEDLPAQAREYVSRLETLVGVPAALISTGQDRDDTILRHDAPVADWLAS